MFTLISENISLQIELFVPGIVYLQNRIDKYWNNFEFKYKADPTGLEALAKVFLSYFL